MMFLSLVISTLLTVSSTCFAMEETAKTLFPLLEAHEFFEFDKKIKNLSSREFSDLVTTCDNLTHETIIYNLVAHSEDTSAYFALSNFLERAHKEAVLHAVLMHTNINGQPVVDVAANNEMLHATEILLQYMDYLPTEDIATWAERSVILFSAVTSNNQHFFDLIIEKIKRFDTQHITTLLVKKSAISGDTALHLALKERNFEKTSRILRLCNFATTKQLFDTQNNNRETPQSIAYDTEDADITALFDDVIDWLNGVVESDDDHTSFNSEVSYC